MPDIEKVNQVRLIAKALFRIAPPGRPLIANDLYDQGVRIDPDLATKEVVSEGPSQMGNWAPQHLEKIPEPNTPLDPDYLIGLLRRSGVPSLAELADQIDAVKDDPERAAALLADLRTQYPDVIATAEQMLAKAKPEDLE